MDAPVPSSAPVLGAGGGVVPTTAGNGDMTAGLMDLIGGGGGMTTAQTSE